MYERHSDSILNVPIMTIIMFLWSERERKWRIPVKTVEKLGNGKKTIEAKDRIDGSNVVFCASLRRVISYSSHISSQNDTILYSVDFVCFGVANKFTNEQTIYGSFEQEFGMHDCPASLTNSTRRSISQRVKMGKNITPLPSFKSIRDL